MANPPLVPETLPGESTDYALDRLDADEMWDLARYLRPDLTREQYDAMFEAFARLKREKAQH